MSENIRFIYNHCSPANFSHDISFDEDVFKEILSECRLVNPSIVSIEVFFEMNQSQSTGKFCCAVLVHLPKTTELYVKEESNDNFAQTCVKSCHKAVRVVKEEHEKSIARISVREIENELEQIE